MKTVVWSEFAELWNASNSVAEVISKTGQTKAAASTLASRMRKEGFILKHMPFVHSRSLFDRFREKVIVTGECWLWTGSTNRKGYGQIQKGRRGGRPLLAHRVAYEYFRGKIPVGMVVMHGCDNPQCVNPSHLSLGTPKDNSQDMADKERANGQKNQPHHNWWIEERQRKSEVH